MPKFSTAQLVSFIKAHAITNYSKGWDVVSETLSDDDLAARLEGVTTQKGAIAAFQDLVSSFNEQRTAHRNEALLMGAEPTAEEITAGRVQKLFGTKVDNSSILTPTEEDVLATLKGLTIPEQHLLSAIAHCENTPVNGSPKSATDKSDLSTWVWLDERKVGSMTTAQKKGVLSSLVKKGLLTVTPDDEGDLVGWSQLGFDVVQALLEDELPPMPEKHGDATGKQVKAVKVAKPAPKRAELADRVLVQPAADLKDVKPLTAGSKRHLICEALARGTTMDHLAEVTGWKKDVVSSALYYDVKQAGLGVERKGGKLFLIMPEGVKKLPVRDKTTSRADALVAACK